MKNVGAAPSAARLHLGSVPFKYGGGGSRPRAAVRGRAPFTCPHPEKPVSPAPDLH
jgi:hypothetical protein